MRPTPNAEIRDVAFSRDGRCLSYSTYRAKRLRAKYLHEFASDNTVASSPVESGRAAVFTADDHILVINEQPFVSDRDDESLIVEPRTTENTTQTSFVSGASEY